MYRKAIIFGVKHINSSRPLNQIHKRGDQEVICKQATSSKSRSCTYGTIFPVETDLSPEEIKEKIRTTYGNNSEIIEIIRIKKANRDKEKEVKWTATKSLRITFKGPLPEKVAVHTSHPVNQYTFPIPKYFKCLRYGHGIMTCKKREKNAVKVNKLIISKNVQMQNAASIAREIMNTCKINKDAHETNTGNEHQKK